MTSSVIKDWIKLVEAEATRYEKVKRESERTKPFMSWVKRLIMHWNNTIFGLMA